MEQLASVAVGRPVKGPFTYLVPPELAGTASARPAGARSRSAVGRALGFYLGPGELAEARRGAQAGLRAPRGDAGAARRRARAGGVRRRLLPPPARRGAPGGASAPGLADPAEGPEPSPDVVRTVVVVGRAVGGRAETRAGAGGRARVPARRRRPGRAGRARPRRPRRAGGAEAPAWSGAGCRMEERAIEPTVAEGLGQARPERAHRRAGGGAGRAAGTRSTPAASSPFLLHGVTGSGKTEVYLRAVEHALARGGGALVLVPGDRAHPAAGGPVPQPLRERGGGAARGLQDRERLLHWQALRSGAVRIAVGVRSAVFAPGARPRRWWWWTRSTTRRSSRRRSSATRRATWRWCAPSRPGRRWCSARPRRRWRRWRTPAAGRYRHLRLPRARRRPADAPRRAGGPPRGAPASRPACPEEPPVALAAAARRDGRDARPRAAGHPLPQPPRPQHLPGVRGLRAGRPVQRAATSRSPTTSGPGTSCATTAARAGRVPDALPGVRRPAARAGRRHRARRGRGRRALSPGARVARLDRDAATTAERLTELLARFARRELDVLVGTQMVAKGHDFPGVTLVCVVLADTGLLPPGLPRRRAHLPAAHPGLGPRRPRQGAGAGAGADLQPGGRRRRAGAGARLRRLRRAGAGLAQGAGLAALQPAGGGAHRGRGRRADGGRGPEARGRGWPCSSPGLRPGCVCSGRRRRPLARLRGKTRWQLLLKAPRHALLGPLLDQLERDLEVLPAAVRVVIDVDPGAML